MVESGGSTVLALCYRNRTDQLRSDGPLDSYADLKNNLIREMTC